MTPERAKKLEGAAVVYDVGFTGGQIEMTQGVLMDVGPDCFNKKRTTALLVIDATVKDLPKHRRNFNTLLITTWYHVFEHEKDAKAHAVGILRGRVDAINKEIRRYS